MELIVKIPDEAYELLKSKPALDNIAESIIANGTPYNPTGDAISREDLINAKPEFLNEKVVRDTKYQTTKSRIYARAWNACNSYWLNTIKNAKTVEEVSVIEFKEPLPLVKAQKIVKALSKRQQGEWIYHEEPDYSTEDDCIVYYQCSICGRRIYSSTVNVKDYPFCHCGAKMKGGAR